METKPKILYVDDEPLNLELFEINFSSLYDVLTCTNGFDAFEILKENEDLKIVISDLKMPLINGFDFLKKVKEDKPEMKCFLMSGYYLNEQIANAIDSGLILDHFMKPFDIEDIKNSLGNYL